jgi:hypothetical protein
MPNGDGSPAAARGRLERAFFSDLGARGTADDHPPGCDQDQDTEAQEKDVGVQGPVECGPGQGPRDSRKAEEHTSAHAHSSRTRVRAHSDECGTPDQEQTRGGGRLGDLAGAVHERGNGEDRSAAAKRAERQPDEEAERRGQPDPQTRKRSPVTRASGTCVRRLRAHSRRLRLPRAVRRNT